MATKKASKIVTPIDKRETFVSLQKNMSDTDSGTMEQKLRTLFKIQKTDTEIDRIYLQRGELPLEVQDLEDEIEGLRTRIENMKAEIAETEKANAGHKLTIEDSKRQIEKYEAQRENVKNNREYDSISKEIEFQELEQMAAEKKIRENNEAAAQKKESLADAEENLTSLEEALADKKVELDNIVEETAKQEEDLLKEKAALVSQIDERMMAAYDKVRANAHNKLAVVTVDRDACGGCFNKIPHQRRIEISESKKIIVCEYCGRILVSPDFDKE